MQWKAELWYRLGWMVVGDLWNYWCNTDFPGSCGSHRLYTYGFAPIRFENWQTSHFCAAQHPDANCGLSSSAATAFPWEHCSLETVPVQKLTNLLFYFILFLQLWRNNSKYRKAVPSDIYPFTGSTRTLLSGSWIEVKPHMQDWPEELLECILLD